VTANQSSEPGRTSCPGTRRTNNRRNKLQRWWQTQQWKSFVQEHIAGQVCARCGKAHGEVRLDRDGNPKTNKKGEVSRVILTVNHISRRKYKTTLDEYCTWDDDCEVCCTVCNRMYEKGMIPCPVCKSRYIRWDEEMCLSCYLEKHPEEREKFNAAREQREIDRKARAKERRAKKAMHKFPCQRRGLNQKCRRKPGEVCTYSARTWQRCKYAREKEAVI